MSQKVEIEIRLDNAHFAEDANKVKMNICSISRHAATEGEKMGGIFDDLGKKVAGAFAVSKLVEFQKKIIDVRSEMESLRISFETLAGEHLGKQLYEDIKEFSVQTPMMMSVLAKGAQTLFGFNIEAQKVMPILRQIGDISMGDAQKFNSLTLAFAQMSSTGKLMGQDLLQMINAGFNPLVIIAEKTGKTVGQLKEEMSQGAISVEMVEEAFRDATAEGGKFHDMLKKQSEGLAGAYSNLKGAIEDMLNGIGGKEQGLLIEGAKLTTTLVQNYEKVASVIQDVVVAFGLYKGALMAADIAQKAHVAVMELAKKRYIELRTTQGLSIAAARAEATQTNILTLAKVRLTAATKTLTAALASNPYTLVAVAVAGLAFGIYKLATAEDAETAARRRANEEMQTFADKLDEQQNKIKGYIQTIQDVTATEYQKAVAWEMLNKMAPTLTEKYDKTAIATLDLAEATKELNEQADKANYEHIREEISKWKETIEGNKRNMKDDARYNGGRNSLYYLQQLKGAEAQLETYLNKLAEIDRIRRKMAEDAKPIEIRIKEANENTKAKQSVFDFYKKAADLAGELKTAHDKAQNTISDTSIPEDYDKIAESTRQKYDDLIADLESDIDKLRAKVLKNPAEMELQMELEKAYRDILNMKSDWERTGVTTIPLFFQMNFNEVERALKDIQNGKGMNTTGMRFDGPTGTWVPDSSAQERKKEPLKTPKKGAKGTDPAERIKEEQKRLIELQKSYEQERLRATQDMETRLTNLRLSLMQDGASKVRMLQEQQSKQELDDITRQKEDAIRRYIEEERKLFEQQEKIKKAKNPKYQEQTFDETSVDVSTISSQYDEVLDLTRKKQIQDIYQQSLESMRDFLKQWGDYEQQRLAITQEYEEKIQNASNPAEAANLMMQRDEELTNLESEQLQEKIDWSGVFSDLEGHTEEYLEKLRDQLQSVLDKGDLPVNDMSVIQKKIQEINTAISKQGGMFKFASERQLEHNRRIQEAADAQDRLKAATEEEAKALEEVNNASEQIKSMLSAYGIDTDVDIDNELPNIFEEGSEEFKKMSELVAMLTMNEGKLAKARKNVAKATTDADEAQDAANENLDDKVARHLANVNEWVQTYLGDLPGLLKELGIGGDEKVNQGLSGVNDVAGAAADYASGNYVGAALKAVSAIKNFGEAFGVWSNSNRAEVEAANKKLETAMDVNTEAVNRLTDAMEKATPEEALKSYEAAVAAMKANEQAQRQIMENNAYMYDGGHSLNSDLGNPGGGYNWMTGTYGKGLIEQIFEYLGLEPDGDYDLGGLLRTLTASDWNRLYADEKGRDLLTRLGQEIAKAEDDGNYNGIFQDILDFVNSYSQEKYDELLNKFNEALTKVSFDTMYDNFVSALMEMDKDAEDFANDFEGYLRNAIYQSLAAEKIKPLLEKWYGAFAYFMSDGKLTKEEIDALRNTGGTYVDSNGNTQTFSGLNDITAAGIEMRDAIEQLGLYSGEAAEEIESNFDSIKSAFQELVDDPTQGIEEWGRNLRNSLIKEFIKTQLLGNDFEEWAEEWSAQFSELWKAYQNGDISRQELDDELMKLEKSFSDRTDAVAQGAKAMMEAMGYSGDSTSGAFSGLRDTFLDTLTDMESDAESFRKKLEEIMVKDLIEKQVLDIPITVNGMEFDDFAAYLTDWNRRYAEAVRSGNQDAIDALLDELVQVREMTLEQAEELRERLKEVMSDTTFSDMKDSWVSALMDMSKTAEDWAQEVGRTIAEKIINEMLVANAIQPLLEQLQETFNAAISEEGATAATVIEAVLPQLEALRDAYPELQEMVRGIMGGLGLDTLTVTGFSDLRSQFINTLTDMEADATDFGKSIAKTLTEQMIDELVKSRYQEQIDAINQEWREVLASGDSGKIDAIRQKILELYETIGNDDAIKQLLDDLKALGEEGTTPFDNLRSSYLSALMDMSKETKDWTKEISQMIAEAFVDEFVMGTAFDEKLEAWKKRYKEITEDTDLSEEERMRQLKALSELIASDTEQTKGQVNDILKWLGIREGQDQSATMNMAEAATYDQFELYLGMETSHLMVAEQTKGIVQSILSTLQGMSSITQPGANYGEQIFMRLGTTNEYLLAVKRAAEGIRAEMNSKLDIMNSHLAKL